MESNATFRPLTFRIENIPPGTTAETLKKSFFTEDQPHIQVRSIAPAVDNHEKDVREYTATVTFHAQSQMVPAPRALDDNINIDSDFHGFTPLNNPQEPIAADIIAVTGLAGHAFGSWAHSAQNMWLRDYLPRDVDDARVLTYGYASQLHGSLSRNILSDLSNNLLETLLGNPELAKCQDRPIVFIGHSLGCLLIKKALCDINGSVGVYSSRLPVRSIIFLGAPHKGLHTIALETLTKSQPSEDMIRELRSESPTLNELNDKFRHVAKDIDILTCFEISKTKTAIQMPDGSWKREGPPEMMVSRDSAMQFLPREKFVACNGDHSQIAKLKRGENGIYPRVRLTIKRALLSAADLYSEAKGQNSDETAQTARGPEEKHPNSSQTSEHQSSTPVGIRTPGSAEEQMKSQSNVAIDEQIRRLYALKVNQTGHGSMSSNPILQDLNRTVEDYDGDEILSQSSSSQFTGTGINPSVFDRHQSASKSPESTTSIGTEAVRPPILPQAIPFRQQQSTPVLRKKPVPARKVPEQKVVEPEIAPQTTPTRPTLFPRTPSPVASLPAPSTSIAMHATTGLPPPRPIPTHSAFAGTSIDSSITCGSCSGVFHQSNGLRCTVCENYGLCGKCYSGHKGDHDPTHVFAPATSSEQSRHDTKGTNKSRPNLQDTSARTNSGVNGSVQNQHTGCLVPDTNAERTIDIYESVIDKNKLAVAVATGDEGKAQELLASGYDINSRCDNGATPLLVAAVYRYEHLVKLLLEHGAFARAKDNDGHTTLHLLASPWGLAHARQGRPLTESLIDLLLQERPPLDVGNRVEETPLMYAAAAGEELLARKIISRGVNVRAIDSRGWTALHHGSSSGDNPDMITLLIEEGVPVDMSFMATSQCTPLLIAAGSATDSADVVERLIQLGANREAMALGTGNTPLIEAVVNGNIACVTRLLEFGVNLEARDLEGFTPLLLAAGAETDPDDVVELLLQFGADREAKVASSSNTPLTEAVRSGNLECTACLLESGVEIEARDSEGFTPLHQAAYFGELAVVTKLLEHGANPCAKTARYMLRSGKKPSTMAFDDSVSPLLKRQIVDELKEAEKAWKRSGRR